MEERKLSVASMAKALAAMAAAGQMQEQKNRERAKTDPAFAELMRISNACGGVNISGKRQAKKNFVKERGVSPRKFRNYRKGLKRAIREAIRKTQDDSAMIVPDAPLPVIG